MRGACDKLTQSEIWDISNMREAHASIEDIAKALKRHQDTVADVVRQVMAPEFHPKQRGKHSSETIEAMRVAWAKGDSASAIAAVHGVSRNVVIGLAYRLAFPRSSTVQIEARRRNVEKASAARRGLRRQKCEAGAPTLMTKRDMAEAFKLEPYVVTPDEPPLIHSILDLEDNHCRWPIGDTEIGFCGKMRATNYHPYCANHVMRSIRPPPPPPGQTAANDSQPRHRIIEAAE